MVGTTGFEPATSRTPSVRATRLRYVPTERAASAGRGVEAPGFLGPHNVRAKAPTPVVYPRLSYPSRLSPPFEQRQESAQRIAQIEQHFAAQKLRRAFRRVARVL